MRDMIERFRIHDRALRYSRFVPSLYHFCLSLGFQRERMMPSRAFCSDESQGYPVILIAQHFGTFPFDHGQVGGRVATDRHGPHGDHGEDLVIIQASHVGYDAASGRFGIYQRQRTSAREFGDNCGKLCAVMHWYEDEYRHACEHIWLGSLDDKPAIFLDNQFLDDSRREGLFLHLDRLIEGRGEPLRVLSTSRAFSAAPDLVLRMPDAPWPQTPQEIGDRLRADLFCFRRGAVEGPEGHDLLESALAPAMPTLVTSRQPALDAARFHSQVEFDRTYRSIRRESGYRGKNVLFISGLNIDISPLPGLPFPLTKFVPWAAYVRLGDGQSFHLEQDELIAALKRQPIDNPERMSFDSAIEAMTHADEVPITI